MSKEVINVGFIGNPNCGKTTLFNAYTGANLKVANWPGVTVEKKEGKFTYKGQEFKLIDLPGIYSLTSYTMEEKVSRECIMSNEVDVIVDVADASCLERNLYLTLQLIELGKPVVLALNMMDIVEERGIRTIITVSMRWCTVMRLKIRLTGLWNCSTENIPTWKIRAGMQSRH